jgi:hypothetical protein
VAKFYVVKGKRRKGFRTRRGATRHKRHFGGRVVVGKKKRKGGKRRRRSSSRRRR